MAHVQKRCARCRRRIPEGQRACPRCGNRSFQIIARYQGPDGKERSKTFQRQGEAERFLTRQENRKLDGDWVDPRLARTPFREWAARVAEGRLNLRASSRVRDESVLRNLVLPEFGGYPIGEISPQDVQDWIGRLARSGYATATVRKAYQLLAGALDRAVNSRMIPFSPCKGISLPTTEASEMRFLSPEEVGELAEAIAPRFRCLVLAAAYTGARFGELAGLRRGRLDLLRGYIRIEESLTDVRGKIELGPPKTKASRRTISLPPFLTKELALHLDRFGSSAVFVFTAPEGGPLRRNLFRRRTWLPAVRASVGEPCRFHDLRHSHAAMLIAQGVHPKVLQERLGHASIRTTLDTYGHLYEGLDEAAAEGLEGTYHEASASREGTSRQGSNVVNLKGDRPGTG